MYSKELILKDGARALLRPLENEDQENLFKFFFKMPRSDLLICPDNIRERGTIESWFTNYTHKKVFQLGAVKDTKIIAKGTLRKEGSYWQHAAEIKLIVAPNYRGRGLGSEMFKAFLAQGLNLNLEKIVVQFTSDNKGFSGMLDHFNLKPEAVLNSYVTCKGTRERKHLVIASYNLGDWKGRFELYGMNVKN
jgi:RimJ/RimL family protein N-acetyltransferase